jgi:hypothetical protein
MTFSSLVPMICFSFIARWGKCKAWRVISDFGFRN